jgi:hypothetical protein
LGKIKYWPSGFYQFLLKFVFVYPLILKIEEYGEINIAAIVIDNKMSSARICVHTIPKQQVLLN